MTMTNRKKIFILLGTALGLGGISLIDGLSLVKIEEMILFKIQPKMNEEPPRVERQEEVRKPDSFIPKTESSKSSKDFKAGEPEAKVDSSRLEHMKRNLKWERH